MSLLEHEAMIRLLAFAAILAAMLAWEWWAPKRPRMTNRAQRWGSHVGLVAINNLFLRLLVPLTALQVAEFADSRSWGLLHLLALPAWAKVALAVLGLDLAIYIQHVLFHMLPLLWRLHRVHHADLDLDATSGVRFHTLEIVVSMLIKSAAIVVLGASPLSYVLFEILLNATSIFNHSNVDMPAAIDRWLRWLVVTPDMHRVHHSVIRRETNSNFGFNFPLWDRLFGTYRDQPEEGHLGMTIGLAEERDEQRCERLDWILLLPFVGSRKASAAPKAERESDQL